MTARSPEPAPLGDVRAIYFDLDDTLCAYWDACKIGLRRAFEAHRPAGVGVEQMLSLWARAFRKFGPALKDSAWYPVYLKSGGPTRAEQMRLALAEGGIEDAALAERLGEAYGQARDEALALFDGVRGVLERLRKHYPLGVITNGPADVQRQELATLGIEEFFDHVFIEGEMGEGKPVPAVFERAREAVGCEPHQILFVGNSYGHDVRPALEAGWHAVWVRRASDVPPSADGDSPRPEEKPVDAPHPDAVIGDLRELLPLLGLR
ncbi:MAG: HAD family hydrolase [Fimbriimonadaceae bacterium]|nr:HAD family hydrolase [Chthonomonadaceae bacterium]MCO5298228.1 HAD family hydrolase [Fimbriimonadaceae bacterium]